MTMDTQISPQVQAGNEALPEVHDAHPILRKILLGLVVFSFIAIIVFLVYLNGKSIYANGL